MNKLARLHWKKIASKNGIKSRTFYYRVKSGWDVERAATQRVTRHDEYAVYKGEELIVMGTAKDCAEKMGVSKEYINWLTTPTGKKRQAARKKPNMATTAIRLEGED